MQTLTDQFYIIIYTWLQEAHEFYEKNQMWDEVRQNQYLALTVLKNNAIIKLIWDRIEDKKQGLIQQ